MPAQERKIQAPQPNTETQAFWKAAEEGKLMIGKCLACGAVHYYPRAICPFCFSDKTELQQASGNGTIYAYSVMRRAPIPYAIAYVTLGEGPTMMTKHRRLRTSTRSASGSPYASSSNPATAARRCRCSRRREILKSGNQRHFILLIMSERSSVHSAELGAGAGGFQPRSASRKPRSPPRCETRSPRSRRLRPCLARPDDSEGTARMHRVGGERGDDWHDVKVSIADVKQDDAVGRELSVIQRKCFPGQKVNRNAV